MLPFSTRSRQQFDINDKADDTSANCPTYLPTRDRQKHQVRIMKAWRLSGRTRTMDWKSLLGAERSPNPASSFTNSRRWRLTFLPISAEIRQGLVFVRVPQVAGKTQVYMFPQADFIRHRLKHSRRVLEDRKSQGQAEVSSFDRDAGDDRSLRQGIRQERREDSSRRDDCLAAVLGGMNRRCRRLRRIFERRMARKSTTRSRQSPARTSRENGILSSRRRLIKGKCGVPLR